MVARLTNRQIAKEAGLSVTTLKRWHCWLCEADMLSVRRGQCMAIGSRCHPVNMQEKFRRFCRERRDAKEGELSDGSGST